MSDQGDNLIPFPTERPERENPIFRVTAMPKAAVCGHGSTVLDHKNRILACSCGAILDPYDYLARVCDTGTRWERWRQAAVDRADAESRRYERLQKEVVRLKMQKVALEQAMAGLERQCRIDFGKGESEIKLMKERLK